METSKVISAHFKQRAKRLRNALESVLQVKVTHAQSLELVAKEENFPNWDAASGSVARGKPGLVHASSAANLQQRLTASGGAGELVLVWGVSGSGKTTTIRGIVDGLRSGGGASRMLHSGCPEAVKSGPGVGTTARYVPEILHALSAGPLTEKVIVVDEVRDPHSAFAAVALAMAGKTVIAAVHSCCPEARVRSLLDTQGAGAGLLDALIANGRLMALAAQRVLTTRLDPHLLP